MLISDVTRAIHRKGTSNIGLFLKEPLILLRANTLSWQCQEVPPRSSEIIESRDYLSRLDGAVLMTISEDGGDFKDERGQQKKVEWRGSRSERGLLLSFCDFRGSFRRKNDAGKGKLAGGEGRVDYYEGHSLQTAVRSTAFRRFGHSGMSILPLKSGEMDSAAPDHNWLR